MQYLLDILMCTYCHQLCNSSRLFHRASVVFFRFLFVCDVMNIPAFYLECYCCYCCFYCASAVVPGRPSPPTFGFMEFVLCIYITSQQVLCINIDKKISSFCVLNFWGKTNTMCLMNEYVASFPALHLLTSLSTSSSVITFFILFEWMYAQALL